MKKNLKDYFVPHDGNDFRPYIFRKVSVAVLSFLIVGTFFASGVNTQMMTSTKGFLSAVLPGTLIDLSNEDRSKEGLEVLAYDSTLEEAAQLKANDMAAKGYFSHDTPDGKNPWYWFDRAGYTFRYAGENLAVNFSDSEDVEEAWMDSLHHRENILDTRFTEIGIATAEGEYEGDTVTFVVQLFGTPKETASGGGSREVSAPENEEQTGQESDTTSGESDVQNEEQSEEQRQEDMGEIATRLEEARTELESVLGEDEDENTPAPQESPSEPTQLAQNDNEDTSQTSPDAPPQEESSETASETENANSDEAQNENNASLEDGQDSEGVEDATATAQQENESTSTATTTGFENGPTGAPLAVTGNNAGSSLSSYFDGVSLSSLFTLRVVYFLLGALVLFSLGLMLRYEAHQKHPQNAFAGAGLVVLMVFFSYTAQVFSVPMVI